MKTPNDSRPIPAAVLGKLIEVRRQDRRVRWGTALLRGAVILLGVMLAAMAIDWVAVLYEPRWRWALTLTGLAGIVAGLVYWGLAPVKRRQTIAGIAREVDAAYPALQERFSTLADFAQSHDAPELRGSAAMMNRVAQEATALTGSVTAEAVVPRAGLSRALQYFGAAVAILAVLLVLDFSRTTLLVQRFWEPGRNLSLTQVQAKTGDLVVGKGESATLEFTATGKPTAAADITIRAANDHEEMASVKRGADGKFVYEQKAIAESFEYRARSGDGQSEWHKVTVAERPKISQVKLRIIPPAYSHLPTVEEAALPHEVRALEGSQFEASFQADQPLTSMALKFGDGRSLPITEGPDHAYHFRTVLTNSLAFTPIFTNHYRLDNEAKPTCEVVVFRDQPPAVKIITPNDEITARPDDKVKIEFEAQDDLGVASARLVVTKKDDVSTNALIIPIPLQAEAGNKSVRKQVELDLAQLHLKQDEEVSYVVQVTDTRENRTTSGQPAANQNAVAQSGNNAPATDSQSAEGNHQNATNQPAASALAVANQGTNQNQTAAQNQNAGTNQNQVAGQNQSGNQNQPGSQNQPASQDQNQPGQNQNQNSNSSQNQNDQNQPGQEGATNQNQVAANSQSPSNNNNSSTNASDSASGLQPPPNNMSTRELDAGQASASQAMKIKVDEWGRTFEGQQREKLEIAIDPVLKQLDALLKEAQELADGMMVTGKSAEGLSTHQSAPLELARGQLRQADTAVTELKNKTTGTPYAFIGLQLHNIRDTHISPARQKLGDVLLDPARAADDVANLEQVSFHIKRAREMIADLVKNYESVKRDNKLADDLQRLKKMHQIFLEDTQAMLGQAKPPINSPDRKVAEVDDAYAEKLRKLLEEQKKITAELAKILAEDPRLLRRFLALQQLENTSLRDHMTLLARRQQSLARQAALWAAGSETNRAPVIRDLLAAQAAEQNEVAALATKLHEDMLTWLPLDVPPDSASILACLDLAADAARLATEASQKTAPETLDAAVAGATRSLDQLRDLNERLPGTEWLGGPDHKLSTYIATRQNDIAALITRESGWIKKIESLRKGDYLPVAEVDQHRLAVDTTGFSEKVDIAALSLSAMSTEIEAKARELTNTIHTLILPRQTSAVEAFSRADVVPAVTNQADAVAGFAIGEKQFDELLKLVIAKLDAAPPPTNPGDRPKSLEEMLAMLQDEKKAAESLGIPIRPINVNIMKDWTQPSSQPGQQPGQGRAQTQARAAQNQSRQNAQRADRLQNQTRAQARQRATEAEGTPGAAQRSGPVRPARSWNTVVSKLGDELRQGRDNVPPEQYRQAIEEYFNLISDKVPVAMEPAPAEK